MDRFSGKRIIVFLATLMPSLGLGVERERLALYRGLIEEGKNLEDFCQRRRPVIRYTDTWTRDQSIRSTMATVQLIGLETTTKAIAKYAEYFQFDSSDYTNLVDNLVGNFCSKNISVMSVNQLREKMNGYLRQNDFLLPSKDETIRSSEKEYRKNEFKLVLDLFKVFCSWGGDAHEATLLPPLLRDPVWMSFVGRHMGGAETLLE